LIASRVAPVEFRRVEVEFQPAEFLAGVHVWPLTLEVVRHLRALDFRSDPADEIIAATMSPTTLPSSLATACSSSRSSSPLPPKRISPNPGQTDFEPPMPVEAIPAHRRDPFDRILIAQTQIREESSTLAAAHALPAPQHLPSGSHDHFNPSAR
jgi:PIN domain nuclease of toxin-antitoxin system